MAVTRSICAFCGIDYSYNGNEKYEITKDKDIFFTSVNSKKYLCGRSSVYEFRHITGYKTVVDRAAYDKKWCTTCGIVDESSSTPSGSRVWTVKIETGTVPMFDFYVEDNHKLTENTSKYHNRLNWDISTRQTTGSDGQIHGYNEGKTKPEQHSPNVPYAWNWNFGGYYTDKECTKKFDFNTSITCDMHFT